MRLALAFCFTLLLGLPSTAQEIVITFGGDVNFARSRQAPSASLIRKFGSFPIAEATAELRGSWDGDVNFVNAETVVSARHGLPVVPKTYVFQSHPDNFRHLMDLGVNAFSLANNHAADHSFLGMRDTLEFFETESTRRAGLLFAGVGVGAAAFAPRVITIKGVRIALSALSFGSGGFSPTESRIGVAYLSVPKHYQAALDAMKAVQAEIKIMSFHFGVENALNIDWGQKALFQRAVQEAGVNLVIGHHPHVVRGVEVLPQKAAAIFYSMGNLLFIGGAEKDSKSLGADYGLLGKAYFYVSKGKTSLNALEAVPFKGVHLKPRKLSFRGVEAHVSHLNRLSRSNIGEKAAQFSAPLEERPKGVQCLGAPYGKKSERLCCQLDDAALCDLPDLM